MGRPSPVRDQDFGEYVADAKLERKRKERIKTDKDRGILQGFASTFEPEGCSQWFASGSFSSDVRSLEATRRSAIPHRFQSDGGEPHRASRRRGFRGTLGCPVCFGNVVRDGVTDDFYAKFAA